MHFFYLREAWRAIREHRRLALTAMLSCAATLAIAGVFLLFAYNAEVALERVGDRRELVVYLRDDVKPAARDALMEQLRSLYGSVTYVGKEEAWQRFAAQLGDPALLEAVGENPLPASLHVKLRPELLNYDALERTAQQVAQFREVEDVRYGGEWARRLDEVTLQARRLALAVGAVVAACVMLILYNTLRLSELARRQQVEIMSHLGASDGFITMPFVFEAVIQAAAAAALALLLLGAAREAVSTQLVGMSFLPWAWVAGFVGAAVALGALAAWLALWRALRKVGP